jgi:hypothetical protein
MQTLFTRKMKATIFFVLLGVVTFAHPAIVSRLTTFTDGTILTASDLNSEFNNIINTVNNLDNDNISSTANIAASKLSATIAGDGIGRDSGTGALSVNADGVGLELSGDDVQLKDDGVTNAKIRESVGLSVIGRSANTTGNVADITSATDGHVLRQSGTSIGFGTVAADGIASNAVTTVKILDAAVTQAKRAALGQQVSASGSGTYSLIGTTESTVTNLSVTITTTGRPVFVGMIHDPSVTGNQGYVSAAGGSLPSESYLHIRRDSTYISRNALPVEDNGEVSAAAYWPVSSFSTIDTPAAGTYTYTIRVDNDSVSDVIYVYYAKLIAYEL